MASATHDLITGTQRTLRIGTLGVVACLGAVLVVLGAVMALVSTVALSAVGLGRRGRSAEPRTQQPARPSGAPQRLAVLRQDPARS